MVAWTCNPILERWSQEGWEVKASWGYEPSVYGCGWEELLGASRSAMLPRCQNRRNSRQVSYLLQIFLVLSSTLQGLKIEPGAREGSLAISFLSG